MSDTPMNNDFPLRRVTIEEFDESGKLTDIHTQEGRGCFVLSFIGYDPQTTQYDAVELFSRDLSCEDIACAIMSDSATEGIASNILENLIVKAHMDLKPDMPASTDTKH